FAFDWGYDSSGRLASITYPTIGASARFGVTFGYGGDGHVASVARVSGGMTFWSKNAVADDGQLFKESFGDGLFGLMDRDPVTGRVTHIAAGSGSIVPEAGGGETFSNALQSLGYQYQLDGKLSSRSDVLLGAVETFSYDNLDRLTTWSVSSLSSTVSY